MITQSLEWFNPIIHHLPMPGKHLLLHWKDWYGDGSNSPHTEIGILDEMLHWRTLYHPRDVPQPDLWAYLPQPGAEGRY